MNFEACPGETRCSTKETGRIYRILQREPEKEIEEICKSCPLKKTKPGDEPPHLAQAIWIANELDQDSAVCEGFDYPAILDYLDPFEWACLVAIKAARRASENKALNQPRQQPDRAATFDHLQRLSRGN